MRVIHIRSRDELENLDSINFPKDIILSLQDKEEIPVIEDYEKHKFIIIRIPQKINDLDYITIPFGIVVSKDTIVTACFFRNDLDIEYKDGNFVLDLILNAAKKYLSYLSDIDKATDMLEKKLYRSQKNSEIAKLLRLEKSLVYFTTALEHNEILLSEISESREFTNGKNSKFMIKQVRDETRQALSMARTYTDILTNLMDAFASMISNNLNVAMKLLTSITILFAVPTLLSSIYGMNVTLPYAGTEYGFLLVMGLSVFFSIVFLIFFWKNDMI